MGLRRHKSIKKFWSRTPGIFVNPYFGYKIKEHVKFSGTIGEWYASIHEVLKETVKELGRVKFILAGQISTTILSHSGNDFFYITPYYDNHVISNPGFFIGELLYMGHRPINVYKSNIIPQKEIYVVSENGVYIPIKIIDKYIS